MFPLCYQPFKSSLTFFTVEAVQALRAPEQGENQRGRRVQDPQQHLLQLQGLDLILS